MCACAVLIDNQRFIVDTPCQTNAILRGRLLDCPPALKYIVYRTAGIAGKRIAIAASRTLKRAQHLVLFKINVNHAGKPCRLAVGADMPAFGAPPVVTVDDTFGRVFFAVTRMSGPACCP
jgi:hypothetical protein